MRNGLIELPLSEDLIGRLAMEADTLCNLSLADLTAKLIAALIFIMLCRRAKGTNIFSCVLETCRKPSAQALPRSLWQHQHTIALEFRDHHIDAVSASADAGNPLDMPPQRWKSDRYFTHFACLGASSSMLPLLATHLLK
jgi:hypothetical protein